MSQRQRKSVSGDAAERAEPASLRGRSSSSGAIHDLMARAGNRAVGDLLRGSAPAAVQRQFDARVPPNLDAFEGATHPTDPAAARARIVEWLEPQRATIENRALFTNAPGMDPNRGVSMPELIADVREHVPEARVLELRQVAEVIRSWSHVQIQEHKLVDGAVAASEIEAAIQNVLGKPGTVRVEKKGRGWMEVTAGGVEIGRDDSASVDATLTGGWDGSIGASLKVGPVKGSFQIAPDRTWQAQLSIPAGATVPIVNQMANVFGVADRAARTVAGRVDAAGGKVGDVSINVLQNGLSPVKDAIDTLSNLTDRENPVSVGVTAGGDLGTGAVAIEATVTIRW